MRQMRQAAALKLNATWGEKVEMFKRKLKQKAEEEKIDAEAKAKKKAKEKVCR